jgi:hypothetical protein
VSRCTARLLLATACVLGTIHCGPKGSDVHGGTSARSSASQVDEAASKTGALGRKKSNEPKLDGTRCAAFVPFLPAKLEGFRAKGPAEGSDIELGEGAALALLRRAYWKPGIGLDIEIIDTEQGKRLRDVFEQTRKLDRSNDSAVIKATEVQGHQALAQWNSTSRSNRLTILVASRYLVNLNLRPAGDISGALSIANELDLAELAKLQPSDQIAAQK